MRCGLLLALSQNRDSAHALHYVGRSKFHPQALRDMAALDKPIQRRIQRFIDERLLKLDDPRQIGERLKGPLKNYWKYRQGDWRLICELRDGVLTVYVVRVGNRREIYD